MIVELVILPDEPPATYAMVDPYPILPTVPSPFAQIALRASSFLEKMDALPLQELITTATRLLADADALFRTPAEGELDAETVRRQQDAPLHRMAQVAVETLDAIHDLVSGPDAKRLPAELVKSLRQLDKTLKSAQRVLDGNAVESPFYYEVSTALRELTSAARAVRALTETLEETPNAVIFGR